MATNAESKLSNIHRRSMNETDPTSGASIVSNSRSQTPLHLEKTKVILDQLLLLGARGWFMLAFLGQLIFILYISSFYGSAALQGDWSRWNRVLPVGYIPGDTLHNIALATHLFLAVTITISGALQLSSNIRQKFRDFHRLNGKIYFATAILTSVAGTFMIWTRTQAGDLSQDLGVTFNAIVIVVCVGYAYQLARARQFQQHQQWAIRLFLVVSGTWFFRVGLFFWLTVNQGPVGFDPKSFSGPFLSILSFSQTIVPLLIAQLYFKAKASASAAQKLTALAVLMIAFCVVGIGIFSASFGMWIPRITS